MIVDAKPRSYVVSYHPEKPVEMIFCITMILHYISFTGVQSQRTRKLTDLPTGPNVLQIQSQMGTYHNWLQHYRKKSEDLPNAKSRNSAASRVRKRPRNNYALVNSPSHAPYINSKYGLTNQVSAVTSNQIASKHSYAPNYRPTNPIASNRANQIASNRVYPAATNQIVSNRAYPQVTNQIYPISTNQRGYPSSSYNGAIPNANIPLIFIPRSFIDTHGEIGGPGGCFRHISRAMMVNTYPIDRRYNIDIMSCLTLCLMSARSYGIPCTAIDYRGEYQCCDLYALRAWDADSKLIYNPVHNYYEVLYMCSNGTTGQTTPPPTPGLTTAKPGTRLCGPGKSEVMQQAEGWQLVEVIGWTVDATTVTACQEACRNDQGPSGEVRMCLSADFNIDTRTCFLSDTQAARPLGSERLRKNPKQIYIEKLCIADSIASRCRNGYVERFPQMVLFGAVLEELTTFTYDDCVAMCLASPQCKSAEYFYEAASGSSNCLLNSADYTTSPPDNFRQELGETVEHFALSKCR